MPKSLPTIIEQLQQHVVKIQGDVDQLHKMAKQIWESTYSQNKLLNDENTQLKVRLKQCLRDKKN